MPKPRPALFKWRHFEPGCLRGPLVSAVLAFVSGRRGIDPGTRSRYGPHHHLALGAALRTRTEQEMAAGIEYQPTVPGGSTKPTSARAGTGGTCIVPWI